MKWHFIVPDIPNKFLTTFRSCVVGNAMGFCVGVCVGGGNKQRPGAANLSSHSFFFLLISGISLCCEPQGFVWSWSSITWVLSRPLPWPTDRHGWFYQLVLSHGWMHTQPCRDDVCASGDVRSLCRRLLITIVKSGSLVKILKK